LKGANLGNSDLSDGKTSYKNLTIITIGKMVVLPAIGFALVIFLNKISIIKVWFELEINF